MANIFADMDAKSAGVPDAPMSKNVFAQMDHEDQNTTSFGNIAANLPAGANEAIADIAGAPVDLINFGMRQIGAGSKEPIGGSNFIKNRLMGSIGANPDDIKATTPADRITRSVGAGAVSAFFPEGKAMTVGKMIANGMWGALSGAGAGAAEEVAPEEYKPLAGMAGGLAAGLPAAAIAVAAPRAASAVKSVVDPFVARFSANAAERQAGQTLAGRASNPASVREMLANGPDELVPGSKPTTFQQTGDVGLGSLEREVATKNPDQFAARRGDQNAARRQALTDIQHDGDPTDVAKALKSNFDELDAATQRDVDRLVANAQATRESLEAGGLRQTEALTANAQRAGNDIRGNAPPEAHGAAVREAIDVAEDAARARERGLWQAVDPHGDLMGNVTQTSGAAREIVGEVPKTAKPLAGEESAIFTAARELPALAPVQDLIALRSRVSTEMRNELIANGRSPSYARLTRLRGAIQDNLNTTISQKVANEAGEVSRGTLAQEDTTASKIQGWVNDYRQRQQSQTGGGGGASAGAPSATGATGALDTNGAEPGIPEGPASAGSPAGLPWNASPSFDDAASSRLAAATDATRERARTFGTNPIAPVTAKAGASDIFRLPEARVPQKFFHPGPTGYTDMQALYAAVGREQALPIIEDYAASSLRRAAMRDDGTLDPRRYQQWLAQHADSMRALPQSTRDRFGAAAQASSDLQNSTRLSEQALREHTATAERTIADAEKARSVALKDAQAGATGRLIGATSPEDVTRIIGGIFGSRTAVADMGALAVKARANPLTMNGLRQAVADHIVSKYISNTEAGTSGSTLFKADQFQTFMKQNRATLARVFSPDEISTMEAIAKDIQRAKRSENAVKLPGGSNTAQDTIGVASHSRQASPATRRFIDIIGATIGTALGGIPGTVVGGFGADVAQSLRAAGIERVDQLVTQAMLHPEIASALLKKVPVKPNTGSALTLARAIRNATTASLASTAIAEDRQRKAAP